MTEKSIQNVTVLGAGRWGTAMAIYLSRQGLDVTLQSHSQAGHDHLMKTDTAINLPNFSCEGKIRFEQDLNRSTADAELIVLAMPVAFLSSVLKKLDAVLEQAIFLSINKGIDRDTLETVPEVIKSFFPQHTVAHLGGPCFPEGLLSDITPAAETLACENPEIGKQLQQLFSSRSFRVYGSQDLNGVATLGALKNIYAIIAGIADGSGMVEEVISVLVTRGLSEMKRYCERMNISLETLYGLSGLGDLALTCYSPKSSHNKNFGVRLGRGESVESILNSMAGTVAEGYYTTKAVWDIAHKEEIDLPLCKIAYEVIYQGKSIQDGLAELMTRPLKDED